MRQAGMWCRVAVVVVAAGAAGAFAQETRVIQPSPAYYQQQGAAASEAVPEAQQPVYHTPPRPAPVPVQPAVAPAPVQPAVQPRPLPPHPRSAQPAGTMKPLPVQPRPVSPAARPSAQPAGAMKPLPVQPRPGQPAAASAAPMTPLPVQPRSVQPAAQPVVQPAPVPVQPRIIQPVAPVARPLPVAPVQPVAQPRPVPARVVQPVAAPMAPPAPMPVAPVAAPAPARVDTQDQIYFPAAIPAEPAPAPRGTPGTRIHLAQAADEGDEWVYDDSSMDSGYRWPGLALGPKFGTTGIGADLTFGLTRYLNLRGGFNYAAIGLDKKFGGVKYDTDLDMIGIPLLVDLYPAGGHFRLTGGVFIQPGWSADLSATPGSPVQIGNHVYGPDVVGTLTGKIEADPLAPYLGIGFGNAVGEDQWLTFSLDIGVVFQTYDVALASDGAGMTAKLDTFREDMKKEEQNLQKDADNFKFYPVLTLGISYHF
jgi:hypothetical protein